MSDPARTPNPASLAFAEDLFAEWQIDPASVSPDWRAYFESLPEARKHTAQVGPKFQNYSIFNPPELHATSANGTAHTALAAGDVAAQQDKVDQLVRSYRVRGHLIAKIDPLERPRPQLSELDPASYGFGEADLDRHFSTSQLFGPSTMTLRQILEKLRATYCRSIGVQFMHIDDLARLNWLRERMEGTGNRLELSRDEQLRILTKLTDATLFEEFIQKKFLGAKSFSLEGSESLIPLMDLAIERAAGQGITDVVVGMAHRGRLNVLANVMHKGARQIFREFADVDHALYRMGGDVKYHLGYTSEYETAAGAKLAISLCFNPSHLEFVDPVAMGRVRARDDNERAREGGLPSSLTMLIHGDAAFAGQGVVQETLNMSQLPGYNVGGTIHVIVNNQVGFTTDPQDGRSTTYATDVARMLQCPILHVNGEDPEAVAQTIRLAMDFRKTWRSDVIVDMYAYRRRGHNEGDEPSFTQPRMYETIRARKTVREGYLDHLLQLGGVTRADADAIEEQCRAQLEVELDASKSKDYVYQSSALGPAWKPYKGGRDADVPEVPTVFPKERLAKLLDATTHSPADFVVHPKLVSILERRTEMATGARPLDWAAGEAAAFATLAVQGARVRLSGQDCERGTFSHRHAVLHDIETGRRHMPLAHLDPEQGPIEIWNSPLSETGVMGFEYGYTLEQPEALIMWEAQFGDFVNAAQVIIDQFLVSAEEKWKRLSGLVLLLPHAFEGQGPEHSSARLERFLQLCADDNIQVANVTTPAQLFHMLRRQVMRPWRKPLVVMTPKSLLRHPRAVSTLDDLAEGHFHRILADVPPEGTTRRENVSRVLLCSGKIYYELEDERAKRKADDVAILRLEQIYPLQERDLKDAFGAYGNDVPVVWVQEEPANMGAWQHLLVRFGPRIVGRPFSSATRAAAASPATGSPTSHKIEQQEVLDRAFGRA